MVDSNSEPKKEGLKPYSNWRLDNMKVNAKDNTFTIIKS